MQGRGWRGLLAGVMIGSVAAAGGCGSSDSGTQVERTKEQTERGAAAKKKIEGTEETGEGGRDEETGAGQNGRARRDEGPSKSSRIRRFPLHPIAPPGPKTGAALMTSGFAA